MAEQRQGNSAWYMMAHIIFMQVFGRDVLPVGKPWITLKTVSGISNINSVEPTQT